jgi:hypothetical protein
MPIRSHAAMVLVLGSGSLIATEKERVTPTINERIPLVDRNILRPKLGTLYTVKCCCLCTPVLNSGWTRKGG